MKKYYKRLALTRGPFHADDVFSTALLQTAAAHGIRSRAAQLPDDFDGIVYDVRRRHDRPPAGAARLLQHCPMRRSAC